jgi:hypothetical protein
MSDESNAKNILRVLLDANDTRLIGLIRQQVNGSATSEQCSAMLSALSGLGLRSYVRTARREAAMPGQQHCVWCHKTYDPRNNTRNACKIDHGEPDEPRFNGHPKWRSDYPCCGGVAYNDKCAQLACIRLTYRS